MRAHCFVVIFMFSALQDIKMRFLISVRLTWYQNDVFDIHADLGILDI